ncbi:MAG: protein-L-isoaspartate O-methyltransferase [Hyphomicrobiaceae bacterium]
MDSAVQRKNMVDSQVRPSDVTDRRIPRAMLEVPREAFVPEGQRAVAYMDGNLVVSRPGVRPERALLAPRTLSKMIQHMAIEPDAVVLDVAPATGYSTAVLARIARKVVAVDCDAELFERAKAALAGLSITNAEVHVGPLGEGMAGPGPYDAILVGGRVATMPPGLLSQLKDGGRLIAILDVSGVGKVFEWRRFAMKFDRRPLFDAEAPMLPGFERVEAFAL